MPKSKAPQPTDEPTYGELFTRSIKHKALAKDFKRQLAAEKDAHAKTKGDYEKFRQDTEKANSGKGPTFGDSKGKPAVPEEETGADGKKVAKKANDELDGHGLKPAAADNGSTRIGGGPPSKKKASQAGESFKL